MDKKSNRVSMTPGPGTGAPFSNNPKLYDEMGNRKTDNKELAKAAFNAAEEFMIGVAVTHERMFKAGKVIFSYTNGAFACELFFKSLLHHYNINFDKKHNLHYLFEVLPENIKNDLRSQFVKLLPNQCLDEQLKEIGDAFVFARYSYVRSSFILRHDLLFTVSKLIHDIAKKEIMQDEKKL